MVPAPGRVKLMEGGLYNVALQRVGSGGEKVGDAAEYLIKVGNTQVAVPLSTATDVTQFMQ